MRILFVSTLLILSSILTSNLRGQDPADKTEAGPVADSMSAKEVLTGNTAAQKLFMYRKYNFINESLLNLEDHTNADLSFNLNATPYDPFSLSNEDIQKLKQFGRDNWDKEIMRRYRDIPYTVPLNGLLGAISRGIRNSLRANRTSGDMPIPTATEIDVLKILWSQNEATSSDIYATLDSTLLLTAEDLRVMLEGMVNKGFLERKRISPLHTFQLFGVAEIAIGPKHFTNEKNKIYLYWPVVSRERLITYLDARRYQAFASSRDRGSVNSSAKYIEEKLIRLLE